MATIATVHSDALPAGRTPAVQLVVVEGPDAGRAARVNEACTVGSERECDLVLTDERVSRKHLRVEASGGSFRVVDLGSRNGTFYEGSRVAEAVVPAGATLKVGRSYLRLSPLPEPLEIAPSQERR
ncbi:MAG: FHA domain-containing protein, partial [Sandaracinaceae bacterium]|nr:FHA domain-containing protein [Sandaracinaceae bacterium]